jgi:hypothetical protein
MTVELGVAELAATRFAVSPLSETVAALQQLAGQHRQALHLRWFRWASDELAARPLDLPHSPRAPQAHHRRGSTCDTSRTNETSAHAVSRSRRSLRCGPIS